MADITGMLQAASGSGGGESDPNFNQTVLLLHGDGSDGAQNNTFLDSSTNNFTITRNGNTTQGTFSPFSAPDGRWSNYFDGSGDYITLPSDTDFVLGAGDFIVEAFVYVTGNDNQIIYDFRTSTVDTGFNLGRSNANGFYVFNNTAGVFLESGAGTASFNTWVHVLVSRVGTTIRLFVDGSEVDSVTKSTDFSSTAAPVIGASSTSAGADPYLGYISNLRVVKGSGVSSVTVPTTPLTAISGTSLLTCQSNRFADNSTNGFSETISGNVKVTPFSPFAPTAAYGPAVNGGSGYFDGSGDNLSDIGTTSDFNFMHNTTALFTFEAWIYHTTSGSLDFIIGNLRNSSQVGVQVFVSTSDELTFNIYKGSTGNPTVTHASTATISANTWTHVCVEWDYVSDAGTMYINGAVDSTFSRINTASTSNAFSALYIGRNATDTQYMWEGYISNLRICNSIVYGGAFTPSTEPLTPTSQSATNCELLCNFTNAGIFDNTGKNNLETVADAQINTTTKQFGTGSMEFDGTGDYLLLPANDALNFSANENFTIEFWIYPQSSVNSIGILGTSGTTGIYTDSSGYIYLHNGSVYINPDTASYLTLDTWQHIAIVRSGGNTVAFYKNGVAAGSYSGTFDTEAITFTGLNIGRRVIPSVISFTGFIDDLRLTKGVARYTATFTPPTAPFPDQ